MAPLGRSIRRRAGPVHGNSGSDCEAKRTKTGRSAPSVGSVLSNPVANLCTEMYTRSTGNPGCDIRPRRLNPPCPIQSRIVHENVHPVAGQDCTSTVENEEVVLFVVAFPAESSRAPRARTWPEAASMRPREFPAESPRRAHQPRGPRHRFNEAAGVPPRNPRWAYWRLPSTVVLQ